MNVKKPANYLAGFLISNRNYLVTRANTLVGDPEPPTIFSGAAITIAPVVGNLSRLRS